MAMKLLTVEQKQALTAMRERMGGISEEKKQHAKQLKAARKAIAKVLGEEAVTVPQIAAALSMATDEALWHITGMRKYGLVAETGEEGDYVLYTLVGNQENATGK